MYQKIRKSVSSNAVNQQKKSQFAPPSFKVQAKQDYPNSVTNNEQGNQSEDLAVQRKEDSSINKPEGHSGKSFTDIRILRPDVPKTVGHNHYNFLQRSSYGRMIPNNLISPIQTKLTIGEPGDKYEQEADWVAAKVVQQINSPATQSKESQSVQQNGGIVQRSLINNPLNISPLARNNGMNMAQRAPGDDQYAPKNDQVPWQNKFRDDHLIPAEVESTEDLEQYAFEIASNRGYNISSIIDISDQAARDEIRNALLRETGNVTTMGQIHFSTVQEYYVIECNMNQQTGEATYNHPFTKLNLAMNWNEGKQCYEIYHYGGPA
jgi:hypothetical protein